jgi:hypothetical protein
VTQVQLLYRRPDGVTPGGVLITEGLVKISSVRRYDSSGGEMTTVAWTSELGDTVTMDPGTWRFELYRVDNGRGGYLTGNDAVQYKLVPASGTFQVDDLTEVDPITDSATSATPEVLAMIAALQAQVNALVISGGGLPPDATTFGIAGLKYANAAAARTAIGVAPLGTTAGTAADGGTVAALSTTVAGKATDTAVVHNTGAETIAGVKTFSSAPVIPDGSLTIAKTTGLQAAIDNASSTGAVHTTGNETVGGVKTFTSAPVVPDGSWSIADTAGLQTALDNATSNVNGIGSAPYWLQPVNGVFPPRPNTTRHVLFVSASITPTLDGALTGGGGMVPNYDLWIRAF